MTDQPPAPDATPIREAAADAPAPAAGDPELAALVRRPAPEPGLGDPDLAALVRLGQRPVAAAVPAPGPRASATPASDAADPAVTAVPQGEVEPGAGSTPPPTADEPAAPAAGEPAAPPADEPATPAAGADGQPDAQAAGTSGPEPAPAPAAAAPDAQPDPEPVPGAEPTSSDASPAEEAATEPLALGQPGADADPIAAAAALGGDAAAPPASPATTAEPALAAPRHRRTTALRFALAFLLGIALAMGAGAGALYAWGQQYDGRVLPGVRVGATDLSGLSRDQAQAAIADAYASLGKGQIRLNGPDGPVSISYTDIGRGPDTAAVLDAALAAGREGEPVAALIGAPQVAVHGITVASAVTYDRARLAKAVAELAASIDEAPVSAKIGQGADGAIGVTPAVDGRAVDQGALLAQLDRRLTALDTPAEIALEIPMVTVPPTITTVAAADAEAAVERMAADLVIVRGTDTWTIPSAQLQPLITLAPAADGSSVPVFDDRGLDPILQALAPQVNQTVQEASLKLSKGHVVAAGQSREGRTLDIAAMKAAIGAQMTARAAGTAIEPLEAQVQAVAPKLSTEAATALAAQMVPISTFSVYYWVIVNNHWGGNIEGPANKINGTVVPAGGTFDFWKVVGDLRQVPGVGPGNAIEGGKITVTGAFGGGICTTSTTLFNAAFRAGMLPIARQAHAEFIDRYPAGLDATVWIVGGTKQTMSFLNDTPYPIVIQRKVTNSPGGKRWLTFKIWSVPNGRTYKISNLVIQPGKRAIDTVEEDPTKPVGYKFRNNAPSDGKKVWVTVTIYDHGEQHWTKTYYSNYPPVNGVLVVGTKGATPDPSPSPSPTPVP